MAEQKKLKEFNSSRCQTNPGIFSDPELDWTFKRYTVPIRVGAADMGELLYVAEKLKRDEENMDIWVDAFFDLGERLEKEADEFLAKGHKSSAKDAYWRASNYFFAAEYGAGGPSNPIWDECWKRSTKSFQKSAPLCIPPIQTVEYPLDGRKLPGYYWRVDQNKNCPTLIVSQGNDTSLEELIFWIGTDAIKRGYNLIAFEYPGSRGCVHMYPDWTKRPELEVYFGSMIDYMQNLPGIDERLALTGFSYGGYVVSRVGIYEKRLRAIVPNSPVYDFDRVVKHNNAQFEKGLSLMEKLEQLSPMMLRFAEYTLAAGAQDWAFIEENNPFTVKEDEVRKTTVPALALYSEQEGDNLRDQAVEWFNLISSTNKKFYEFTLEKDGSVDHCQIDNRTRGNQVTFDWLDELFNYEYEPPMRI